MPKFKFLIVFIVLLNFIDFSFTKNSFAQTDISINTTARANQYILGPGDSVFVELLDIPEYSGTFVVGPDGTLYLPRLKSLYVAGLTVDELTYFLTQQFKTFVREPQVYVSPVVYRPVRVFIKGEVSRPGYYYLSGSESLQTDFPGSLLENSINPSQGVSVSNRKPASISSNYMFTTVFDALRAAGGVTAYSNLSKVSVVRNLPLSQGGSRITTNLDFLRMLTDGDESQNIRLFDGDVVTVGKSATELREQLILAGSSNLNPDYIQVFVTGRVRSPGLQTIRQGGTLDQALAAAGGQKILRGSVKFTRLNKDGIDRRSFFISGTAPLGSYKNPVLMTGDIIHVNDSPLSATFGILQEISGPALGLYSIYSIFNND